MARAIVKIIFFIISIFSVKIKIKIRIDNFEKRNPAELAGFID